MKLDGDPLPNRKFANYPLLQVQVKPPHKLVLSVNIYE